MEWTGAWPWSSKVSTINTYMDDLRKNDSKDNPEVKSMPEAQTACELFRIIAELQEKVQLLQHQLQAQSSGICRALITPETLLERHLHPESIHIRIAEGANFIKALAIIAADLLAEHLQTVGAEIIMNGQPLDLQQITRLFRELQRALQRQIVVETTEIKERLISAPSCLLSARLLKNVSACSYESPPKMLRFKKHLVQAVGRTKL